MRFFYKIAHYYKNMRIIMWILSGAGTVLTPLVGYAIQYFHQQGQAQSLLADNPELAQTVQPVSFTSWLTGAQGWAGSVMLGVIIVGVLIMLALLVLQIILANGDAAKQPQDASQPTVDEADDDYGETL